MSDANIIKSIREALGVSQTTFAKRMNVSNSSIQKIEIGQRNITDNLATKICSFWGVDVNYIKSGQGEMFTGFPYELIETLSQRFELTNHEKCFFINYLQLDKQSRKGCQLLLETYLSYTLKTLI